MSVQFTPNEVVARRKKAKQLLYKHKLGKKANDRLKNSGVNTSMREGETLEEYERRVTRVERLLQLASRYVGKIKRRREAHIKLHGKAHEPRRKFGVCHNLDDSVCRVPRHVSDKKRHRRKCAAMHVAVSRNIQRLNMRIWGRYAHPLSELRRDPIRTTYWKNGKQHVRFED